MRLNGRRNSNNVDDRRSLSGKTIGIGGGILGVIIVGIMTLMGGGSMSDVLSNVLGSGMTSQMQTSTPYEEDAEDARLADLASKVLAGTEDVWTREFQRQGWGEYQMPKMVLFHGSIQSGCGNATAQVGPFYCSADQTIYIDLDFLKNMKTDIGGGGDFAYAYVIAHEVGHHVQYLLGTLDEAHSKMAQLPESEANKESYYAGVWGNLDNQMFNSIEPGDVENAIDVASKIGDDYLQRKAYGTEMPESFNHGRSSQRVKWLSRGLQSGDPTQGNTFGVPYSSL